MWHSARVHSKFGNGHVEESTKKHFYPMFIKGKYCGRLDQAEVNLDCPMLLSKKVMKHWKTSIDFDSRSMKLKKLGLEVPFKNDVPIVNILDVTPKQLEEQWHLIPEEHRIADLVNLAADL